MFPLNSPFRHRAKHICQNVVLNPKAIAEAADPIHPYTSAELSLDLEKTPTHDDQHGLPSDPIRQRSPVEDRKQLHQRKDRFDLPSQLCRYHSFKALPLTTPA
jgi:hypothetical protein